MHPITAHEIARIRMEDRHREAEAHRRAVLGRRAPRRAARGLARRWARARRAVRVA